jgi:hypothetical protein
MAQYVKGNSMLQVVPVSVFIALYYQNEAYEEEVQVSSAYADNYTRIKQSSYAPCCMCAESSFHISSCDTDN